MRAVRIAAKPTPSFKSVPSFNAPKLTSSGLRSFSSQPKGPKGGAVPQAAKGPVSAQQSKTPVPQQSNPNAVTLPDGLRKELIGLLGKQAEILQKEEASNAISAQVKQYLDKTGYKLEEAAEGSFILKKETPSMSVVITFEPSDEMADEAQMENEEEDTLQDEVEGKSKDIVDDEGENQPSEKRQQEPNITVRAEINFKDRNQAPKGVLFIDGFAGYDNRLYVESLMISENSLPAKPPSEVDPEEEGENELPTGPAVRFDDLAQPIQDKMYDLLDSVNIDDNLAAFVRNYLANYPVKSQIEFFDKFKKLLS